MKNKKYEYTRTVTVPAGNYYFGDPCYAVPSSLWIDYFNTYMPLVENTRDENPLDLEAFWYNGCDNIAFATGVGDGCWFDEDGIEYGVDAGMLGLTNLKLVGVDEQELLDDANSGRLVKSQSDVELTLSCGIVTIEYVDAETHDVTHITLNLK